MLNKIVIAFIVVLLPLLPSNIKRIIKHEYGIVKLMSVEGKGVGTGFHITRVDKTYLVTNRHVCSMQVNGSLYAISGGDIYTTNILSIHPTEDVCILEGIEGFKGATRFSTPSRNAFYMVAGHPKGNTITTAFGTFLDSTYINLCVKRDEHGCKYVEISKGDSFDIKTAGGSSGSPIINAIGEVTSIVYAVGIGETIAVPIKYALELIDAL